MNKKSKMLILSILLLGLILIIGTYAWFTWRSSESRLVLTIGEIDDAQVILKPYKIDKEIIPVLTYEGEEYTEVEAINKNISSKTVNLYYHINKIDSELISSDFKYTILRSTDNGNTYSEYISGNFSNASNDSDLYIMNEIMDTNTNYKYQVYLWLDGSNSGQGNISGKSFNGELRAKITGNNIKVDLSDGLIPITYDVSNGTKVKTISSADNNWYNYDNKEWANAVLVSDGLNTQSRKAYDDSGNNTTNTINGASYNSEGLSFDGVDDYVLLPQYNVSTMTNGFTIEARFNMFSMKSMNIFSNIDAGGVLITAHSSNYICFTVYDNSQSKYINLCDTEKYQTGIDYHIVGVYHNKTLKLYVNGKLKNTTTIVGNIKEPTRDTHFVLGCNPGGTSCDAGAYFDGTISQARMYDRALSDSEVLNNYNNSITQSNLLFNFDFTNSANQSNNDEFYDLSGNDTKNTLYGASYNSEGLSFDGTDDYLLLPRYKVSTMTNGFTMEVKFKANNISSSEQNLFVNYQAGGVGIHINNGKIYVQAYDGANSKYISVGHNVERNVEYVAALVFDKTNIKLYLNGVFAISTATSGTLGEPTRFTHFALGCNPRGIDCDTGSYFDGTIYQARMYDRALTDSEILNNYQGNITKNNLLFNFDFKDGKRALYKDTPGLEIPEDEILAYYVYVPRYRYRIWETGVSTNGKEQEIEIVFENKDTSQAKGTKVGEYRTHPAFTFGDTELNGIWVGKFETGGTASAPLIKPNIVSLRDHMVSEEFIISQIFGTSSYGMNNKSDSHMIKNSEWGAVAYLSHSKYGRCNNGVCEEVNINNNSNNFTGYSAVASNYGTTSDITQPYNTEIGYKASTTGNIYGIYDMSGGSAENVMGVLADSNGNPRSGKDNVSNNSGYNGMLSDGSMYTSGIAFPDRKYYDLYTAADSLTACDGGICYGHALSETAGWYGDSFNFVLTDHPWYYRSNDYSGGSLAGLFLSSVSYGRGYTTYGFRSVLSVVSE